MLINSICSLCSRTNCELRDIQLVDCSDVALTGKGKKHLVEQVRYKLFFNSVKKIYPKNKAEFAEKYHLNHAYVRALLTNKDMLGKGRYLVAFVGFLLEESEDEAND